MQNQFTRMQMLYGEECVDILSKKRVAIFGIGGVGGHATEAIARSGVGEIDLFDNDIVSISNLNRQVVALHSTIGMPKVQVMADRIKDINPNCKVNIHNTFYGKDTQQNYPVDNYSFVIDAIDTVSSKLLLIENCYKVNVPIISCMGTGNKLDPTSLVIEKIEKTQGCPLARVMRYECKKRNIKNLPVVYSTQLAVQPHIICDEQKNARKQMPASAPFVPGVAGLILSSYVIKQLLA